MEEEEVGVHSRAYDTYSQPYLASAQPPLQLDHAHQPRQHAPVLFRVPSTYSIPP
jgi:hypothetical protein